MRAMRPSMSRKMERNKGSDGTTNTENSNAGKRQPHWITSVRMHASPMPLLPRRYFSTGVM
jgi:hypothetical protein